MVLGEENGACVEAFPGTTFRTRELMGKRGERAKRFPELRQLGQKQGVLIADIGFEEFEIGNWILSLCLRLSK